MLFEGGGVGFLGFFGFGFGDGCAFVGVADGAHEGGGGDGVAAVAAEVPALVFGVCKDAD